MAVQLQHVVRDLCVAGTNEGPVLGPLVSLGLRQVHCGQKMAEKVLRLEQRLISRTRRPDGADQVQSAAGQQQDV